MTTTDEEAPPKAHAWSVTEKSPLIATSQQRKTPFSASDTGIRPVTTDELSASLRSSGKIPARNEQEDGGKGSGPVVFVYYLIYALVNVIISVPGLYGYAAVIFNHPVFANHMNALSKLVIFSSLVHQLSFCLFSSMPFAIGTVQDAGLIFLSSMANTIANEMEGASEKAIVSTTMVLLSLGTAVLGIVLILVGKFQLANAVSYIPMPVVGGYLAFIGYFCVQAGTALCISHPLVELMDWKYVVTPHHLLLAVPGWLAGFLLTYISRTATHDAILPLTMVAIPALFYLVVYATGVGLEGAREHDWVGQVAPPVPVTDLFTLVEFDLVEWHLVTEILWTWFGMVFVVSFASCLDVAAISMDKGEALDTNGELATVGMGNLMSGLTFGYTGSYIFSQTIFTYRTGVHSRWIGVFIMIVFAYIVLSPVNILQIAPLFFLGSTLIFIGWDLLYEWIVEIRHRVLWSEYLIVWGTFVAIQVVGVDFGILLGVLVAVVDHVVSTAQTTSIRQVHKRSRATWTRTENKTLQEHGYHPTAPKIKTFEIAGPVFFGSSLSLLDGLMEELSLQETSSGAGASTAIPPSPHTPSSMLMNVKRRQQKSPRLGIPQPRLPPPQFCVLDVSQITNLDASAARSCFLQLCAQCSKQGVVVCASGASRRMDWILRSHDVAYETIPEEEVVKAKIQTIARSTNGRNKNAFSDVCTRILLFLTLHEALEFCENAIVHQLAPAPSAASPHSSLSAANRWSTLADSPQGLSLPLALARILHATPEEQADLQRLDGLQYHEQLEFATGERIVTKGAHSNSIFIVLAGAVASDSSSRGKFSTPVYTKSRQQHIVSGAGIATPAGTSSRLVDPAAVVAPMKVATLWPVCGVFGYSDFLLERPYSFGAVSTQPHTQVAKISRSNYALMQDQDKALWSLLQRVLLRASVMDLQNCTCDDV